MKYFKDYPIKKLSWNSSGDGYAQNYYLPETVDELIELIKTLKKNNCKYDIIGHTSNILFSNGYNPEFIIGTRLINRYKEEKDFIVCECGVKISTLSRNMITNGIKGYEGLVDLPGTVGSAIYGNAGCYNCGMDLLVDKIELLTDELDIISLSNKDLGFKLRSSVLKRKEINGVILRAFLKKEKGDINELIRISNENRKNRNATQPGPAKNLGSIFRCFGEKRALFILLLIIVRIYVMLTDFKLEKCKKYKKEHALIIKLLGYKEVLPYIQYGINRFIWLDNKSYDVFYSYLKLVKKLYKNPELEIEIR